MSTTTTLLTLPFLALISLPLAITASITVFFSALALYLQLGVIAIELCYALITNLFTIPPSPNWSLLSFNVSGHNTPNRRRSSDYGLLHKPLAFRGQGRPSLGPRMGSSNPFIESPDAKDLSPYPLETRYPQLHNKAAHSQAQAHKRTSPGFQGLINGDENRDFEGLGGWRCPPSYTKSPGRTTPSSSNSLSDEIDDIAWLSMNSRLELPSQPSMLRRGSSSSTHNLAHAYGYNTDGPAEPYLPRRKSSRVGLSGSGYSMATEPKRVGPGAGGKGHRHHRRSATTSALSGPGAGAISTFGPVPANRLSTSPTSQAHRQTPRHAQPAIQFTGEALRSKSHTSLSEHWGKGGGGHAQHPVSRAGSVSSCGSDYFALQPMSTEVAPTTGNNNTTPKEERKPARARRALV